MASPCWEYKGSYKTKECSPEKVCIIWNLQIDTLPTQKLEFICLELISLNFTEHQNWVFWQMQKLRVKNFNFLLIFYLKTLAYIAKGSPPLKNISLQYKRAHHLKTSAL